MSNVLQEYLVSIGIQPDVPGFQRFQGLMQNLEGTVTQHTFGIAKQVVVAQGTIVGAFAAISGAIVSVVDKAAMADQSYRLMGLRMLSTTDTARKLDMISKALGADLAQIVWDPELHRRAVEMGKDIDHMTHMLGPGFHKDMEGIRDIRFEFSRLGVIVEFLGMKFASDLFKGLAGGREILPWLQEKVAWLEDNIPMLSERFVGYAIPALKETWGIAQDLGQVLKAAGIAFTNIVGLIAGDSSIQGSSLDFEKMATAIGHVAHGFESLLGWITQAELLLAHFASGMSLALTGKFDAALKEFKDGIKELTTGSGAAIGSLFGPAGAVIGGVLGGAAESTRTGSFGEEARRQVGQPTVGTESTAGPFGAASDGAKKMLGFDSKSESKQAPAPSAPWTKEWDKKGDNSAIGILKFFTAGIADEVKTYWDYFHIEPESATKPIDPKQLRKDRDEALRKWSGAAPLTPQQSQASNSTGDVQDLIRQSARQYQVPEAMALAIGKHESGFNPDAKNVNPNGTSDWGVMQLNDMTIKTFGVRNPLDAQENVDTGVKYLAQLLRRYQGDEAKALGAYAAGAGYIDRHPDMKDWSPMVRKDVLEFLQLEKSFLPAEAVDPVKATPLVAPASFRMRSDSAPDVMKQSPVWYGAAPSWMRGSSEMDSGRLPADNYYQARLDAFQQPASAPQAVHNTTQNTIRVDVGGVYVTQPGANAHDVQRSVFEGVRDAMHGQIQGDLVQLTPTY